MKYSIYVYLFIPTYWNVRKLGLISQLFPRSQPWGRPLQSSVPFWQGSFWRFRSMRPENNCGTKDDEWSIKWERLAQWSVSITWTDISIFMAEITAITWPLLTGSPGATLTSTTSPFIGEPTLPRIAGSAFGWWLVQAGAWALSRIMTDLIQQEKGLSRILQNMNPSLTYRSWPLNSKNTSLSPVEVRSVDEARVLKWRVLP